MNLPPFPFHSFLNFGKTAKSTKILKFRTFSLLLLTFCDKLLQICWWWVEKNIAFNFMDFNPLQTKIKYNIPIINAKAKVLL